MKLCDLIPESESIISGEIKDIEIKGISKDTDSDLSEKLFVCIKGTRIDSHNLIACAASHGAAAVLVEHDAPAPDGLPVIKVKNTRRALALACAAMVKDDIKDLKCIGICGTNGKTSTTHFLERLILGAGHRCGTIGTLGAKFDNVMLTDDMWSMTTPDPEILYPMLAKMAKLGAEYVIIETSSHALAQNKLDALSFEVAIFTGLSPEHLDFHGDMESYFSAKSRLFSMSRRAVLFGGSQYSTRIRERFDGECLTVGSYPDCDLMPTNVTTSANGTSYRINGECEVRLQALGEFSVTNSLLAIGAGELIGIDRRTGAKALQGVASPSGRLSKISLNGAKFSVYIDYAHTPSAMESSLAFMRRITNGKLTVVFGCGGDRDRSKRAPMGAAASRYADRVIITSDNSRGEEKKKIIEDILAGVPCGVHRRVITDRRRAIEYAVKSAEEGETIVLIGKGHEKYEIDMSGKHTFSEEEIVRDAAQLK